MMNRVNTAVRQVDRRLKMEYNDKLVYDGVNPRSDTIQSILAL
jgi:hypothetical protein